MHWHQEFLLIIRVIVQLQMGMEEAVEVFITWRDYSIFGEYFQDFNCDIIGC